MDYSVSFGNWLRQRRKALDWTQAQLADKVGCSLALIRKFEADERRPSKQIAGILADILNIPRNEHTEFFAMARGIKPHNTLPPHNLPADQTHFIGRKSELELLQTRIASTECRLLVLTGPGGIGKTRLAIKAAREMLHHFPDGAFFVNLVGVDSADYLVSSLASALSLSFHSLADFKIQLLHHLRLRKLLLILDNYEHLLPRTELISEILGTAPDVKIIVTSRERLNVQEEWGFPVRGLSYPQHATSDHRDFDTVQLFEQRAAQADAHFQLTERDRPFIVRICEMAQGNPLAIELAAASTRFLTCREIAETIQSTWNFPSTEPRNVPERHQSMNAVFEHSWRRLSPKEQIGFMKLAIFRNGFTQSAAQDVADTPIALLTSLQDKSFLTHSAYGRYEIHELLRRYGEMRLNEQPGELADTQGKFIAHYGNLLEDLRDAMWDSRHKQAVKQIKEEIDNIRHAWNLALLHTSWEFFNQSAESAWHYYNDTNLFEEGIALFQQAIARLAPLMHDPTQAFVLAQLFHGPGWFAQRLGRVVEAKWFANQSISFLNTSGLRHVHKEMLIKGSACFIALSLKDYHKARRYAEDILASGQQSGDEQVLAAGDFFQGVISRATADFNAARMHLYEAARAFEKFGSQWIRAYVLSEVGQVELATENWSTAKTLLRKSVNLFYEHDDIGNVSAILILLGTASLKLGHEAEGATCFYEALQKSNSVHALPVILDALIEIALLLVGETELATASDILKIVHSHPEITQDARLRVDDILTNLNRSLLPVPHDEVETTDDLQQAIALALKVENSLCKK